MPYRGDRNGQRGIALIIVLWGLVAIALAAGLAVTLGRDQGQRAVLAVSRAQARHAADGALFRTLAALLDPDQAKRVALDGRVLESQFLGARIWLQVQAEAGKIDINIAEPAVMGRLLILAGADPSMLDQMLAGWMQRRGALGGYQVIEQLVGLPGISAPLLQSARADLTVWNGGLVNPWYASHRALLAATGLAASEIELFVAARDAAPAGHRAPLPTSFVGTPITDDGSAARRVGLIADARIEPDGPLVRREMVVELRPAPQATYRILLHH